MELLLDVVLDALHDTLVLLPFLWVTYLLLEALECKAGERIYAAVRRAGSAGPAIGGVLGAVPQCGFSAMAATLWSGRVVTLGTLVAVLLSTGDELLPVFLAEGAPLGQLACILVTKVCIGVAAGFAVDGVRHLARRDREAPRVHDLCERAHCGCEHDDHDDAGDHGSPWRQVLLSATRHTLQVAFYVLLVTLVLDGLIELVGRDAFAAFLAVSPVASVFIAALVGLVPNCAASVVVAELFLDGTIASAALLAGSLSAAGIAYLVLFRTNANARQNVAVVAGMYALAVGCGLTMHVLGLSF